MQEATQPIILSEAADPLAAAAYRAEAWAGEPFLRDGEDPTQVLAPDTARRQALDDAIAELDAGHRSPSSAWRGRYGLMLGLERVLAESEPHNGAGTPVRRHQIDALAGMLTELIATTQRKDENGNGNGHAELEPEADEEEDDEDVASDDEALDEGLSPEQDP